MYVEGLGDIADMIASSPFFPPDHKQKQLANIETKAKDRTLPLFEKVIAQRLKLF